MLEKTKNSKKDSDDIAWQHCTKVNQNNKKYRQCNHYDKLIWERKTQTKNHLTWNISDIVSCGQVLNNIKKSFLDMLEKKSLDVESFNIRRWRSLQKVEVWTLRKGLWIFVRRGSNLAGEGKMTPTTIIEIIKVPTWWIKGFVTWSMLRC